MCKFCGDVLSPGYFDHNIIRRSEMGCYMIKSNTIPDNDIIIELRLLNKIKIPNLPNLVYLEIDNTNSDFLFIPPTLVNLEKLITTCKILYIPETLVKLYYVENRNYIFSNTFYIPDKLRKELLENYSYITSKIDKNYNNLKLLQNLVKQDKMMIIKYRKIRKIIYDSNYMSGYFAKKRLLRFLGKNK